MALCTIAMWFVCWLVRCFYRRHGDVGDEPEHNIYQKQGKGVVYLRPYEKTNLSLYRDIIIRVTE